MVRHRTASLLSLAGLISLASTAAAQISIAIDFDDPDKWVSGSGGITSYQTDHTYIDNDWLFTGGPALRQTSSPQDGYAGALGTHSWRLRDNTSATWTATYQADIQEGDYVSSFGFEVRRWDGSPSPAYTVSYSVNGGSTFASVEFIDNSFLGSSSGWASFSHSIADPMETLNLGSDQFVVILSATGGERIMIDNFSYTVSAVPEPETYGLLLGLGTLGFVWYRRRWIAATAA